MLFAILFAGAVGSIISTPEPWTSEDVVAVTIELPPPPPPVKPPEPVVEAEVETTTDNVPEPVSEAPAIVSALSPATPLYTLEDFMFMGVINWGGYKYTYYSQSVLPGGGLVIPGRHVNAAGFVADGDGYIVAANDAPRGTVLPSPFGDVKIYDRGTTGNHIDLYTR